MRSHCTFIARAEKHLAHDAFAGTRIFMGFQEGSDRGDIARVDLLWLFTLQFIVQANYVYSRAVEFFNYQCFQSSSNSILKF